ncbi:MAG: GNAT family N-acetyltransferase [Pirellulales bacterium]
MSPAKTLVSAPASYCLFQDPWWLDAVAPDGWSEAVVRKGDEVVARMPYVASRKYGTLSITRPRLTPTLGPWHRTTGAKSVKRLRTEKDNIEALLDQLPPYDRCSIMCHPNLVNLLPFHWAGFQLAVKYTYRFPDLSDLDAIWKGFAENIRSDIRKSQKHVGIECDLGTSQFIATYTKTFQRQGRNSPVSPAFLERLDDVLARRGRRRQLFAVDGKRRIHAAVYMVWDDRCAYYLMGGGDPELRNSGATSLLLWNAIQHAATVSNSFDFEGSMLEPVERFFRAFGAVQTPYYQAHRINSRVLRLAAAFWGRAA